MPPPWGDSFLDAVLSDDRVTRAERRALVERLAAADVDDAALAEILDGAIGRARARLGPASESVLDAVRSLVGGIVTAARRRGVDSVMAEAHFSPGTECRRRIVALLDVASADIRACIYNLTDDRIAEALLPAHGRRVRVRVLTEEDTLTERGSDVARLAAAGLDVRIDRRPGLMHHKFAVIDGRVVVTGSYNWTLGAAEQNHENIVVSDHPKLVSAFAERFDALWGEVASISGV